MHETFARICEEQREEAVAVLGRPSEAVAVAVAVLGRPSGEMEYGEE